VVEKDLHIANLDQDIEVHEEQNARLSQSVVEKDQHIANLDHVIEVHEEQNARLSQSVVEKDQHIINLDQVIAEREQQIANLNQVVTEIRGSTSWRLTSLIRLVGLQVRRIKIILKAIPYALSMCGGYSGLVKHVHRSYKKEGIKGIKRRVLFSAASGASPPVIDHEQSKLSEYGEWVLIYDTLSNEDRKKIKTRISQFKSSPLISVLMPVYNPPLDMLEEAIRSVQTQLYQNWELCIADDASTNSKVRKVLKRYAANDARIKVIFRKENGHISASSNSALELVTGDYLALLDNDDLLPEQALFWIADAIVANPDAGLLYSDEDKIDTAGQRYDPYFKPDWNPDLFLSHNMICHLGVYRTELVRKLGGFREGYEGAQDYDLALRCTAQLTAKQIVHIPRVLYHWRSHPGSTAQAGSEKNYALTAGERSLNDHFLRINVKAKAKLTNFGMYRTRYTLPTKGPLVSLVIPTRNGLDLIKQCIDSILSKTTYKNYEILIVDNNSDCPKALAYFASIVKNKRIRVLRDNRPFNYSALNNAAIKQAKGKYVALINNDIEVISPEWLTEMLSNAIQSGVGAVGARLLYPNDTLQHGGVITGIGGVAGHSHKHIHRDAYGYFARAQLIQTYSAVTGACLVIKKSIFHEVCGLDEENLAIAFNDVDFCLRVREAGYRNVWTPYAELYHHESATRGHEDTPEKQARFSKEVLYMKKRWGHTLMNDPAYSPNLTLDCEDFSYAWPPRINPI
jgi:glycosyltransferase involved in cell wall biosynthesis